MGSPDVIVVGGGVVGLTLSLFMAERGHHVSVIEKRSSKTKSRRSIVLQPNGLSVLDRLHVVESIKARYTSAKETVVYDAQRKEVARINFEVINHRHNYLLPIIPDEVEELLEARANKLGVDTKRDYKFRELIRGEGRIGVKIESSKADREEIYAKVVVGSDGANSEVRHQAGLRFSRKEYADGYVLMLAGRSRVPRGSSSLYLDRGINTGIYPVDSERTYVFHYVPVKNIGEVRARGMLAFKEALAALAPELGDSVQLLKDWSDPLYVAPIGIRVENWVTDHLVLLGDAACSMNPNVGQGLNLALEECYSLAKVLDESLLRRDLSRQGLLGYEHAMKPRVEMFYRDGDMISKMLSTRNRLKVRLSHRVLRNLAKKPDLMREFLEYGAGLRKKRPGILKYLELLF